jgi:hypothetical protein
MASRSNKPKTPKLKTNTNKRETGAGGVTRKIRDDAARRRRAAASRKEKK